MRSLLRPIGIVVVLAALLATAGCLGLGDDGNDDAAPDTATFTEDTGGIEGVITDEAVQPVADATVRLVEAETSTNTTEDGSYAFSNVEPGTHTLRVEAEGYQAAEDEIDVATGEVTVRDLVLATVRGEDAYMTQQELTGFFECGWEIGWNVTEEVPETPGPVDGRSFYLGLAMCAVPNNQLGGNATNDKFSHSFELDPPLHTLVYEMEWDPENQLSEWMTTRMEVQGFSNDDVGTIFRTQGPSPIRLDLGPSTWENLTVGFEEQCEEGNDAYCGYNWEADGYPLQTRVFPAWQCAHEKGGGCAVAQQPFTHYVTGLYNQPVPDGYGLAQ
jgi:hypothetical protein